MSFNIYIFSVNQVFIIPDNLGYAMEKLIPQTLSGLSVHFSPQLCVQCTNYGPWLRGVFYIMKSPRDSDRWIHYHTSILIGYLRIHCVRGIISFRVPYNHFASCFIGTQMPKDLNEKGLVNVECQTDYLVNITFLLMFS